MIDYNKILDDLKLMVDANGLVVINDQQLVIKDETIKDRFMLYKIKQATSRAYIQRLGMNSVTKFTFTDFEKEADRFSYIITHMAYISMTRIGTEGQRGDSEGGKSRQYEDGGIYLLSDLRQITPLPGMP